MNKTSVPTMLLSLCYAALFGTAGCTGSDPGDGRWNVLLVTLDTTRVDRLGCYGHPGGMTPHLDALAAEGVRFDRAISTAGITPMSHASMLTGLNPYAHDLRVFYGELGHCLAEDVPTLPAILAERGWNTAAFISSYPLAPVYGLDRGYQDYSSGLEESIAELDLTRQQQHQEFWQDATRSATQRRADAALDDALGWLGKNETSGPWHLWLHLFDVHDFSLVPPRSFAAEHGVAYTPGVSGGNLAARERMYDFELRYVDSQLGRLLEHLKRTGQFDRTMIVVVADHGQGLTDGLQRHGWILHRLLYDWSIHVPLIVHYPGVEPGGVIPELVRTIDILPTVLEALDLPPPDGVEGRSLFPLLRGERDEPRIAYADALNLQDTHAPLKRLPPSQKDDLYVAMDRRWKLIHHRQQPEMSELYDLELDPLESQNVFAEHPDEAARLMRFFEERNAFRLERREDGGARPNAGALGDLGYTDGDDDGDEDPDADEEREKPGDR